MVARSALVGAQITQSSIYKKAIILVRSLFAQARFLPLHQLVRAVQAMAGPDRPELAYTLSHAGTASGSAQTATRVRQGANDL
jgi:hypothetical protein